MEVLPLKIFLLCMLLAEMSSFCSTMAFSFLTTKSIPKVKSNHCGRLRISVQMSSDRGTATGSKFEEWYQKTFQTLSSHEALIPIKLDESFASNIGTIGKSNVTFRSKAWESKSLRYVRLVSFVGEGYDVFNFVAVPRSGLALPILGIDVVSLPRGSLAAIDFQPHSADASIFSSEEYTCLREIQNRYRPMLPAGGDMQSETQRFFSPFAIWTRIPGADPTHNASSGSSSSTDLMASVGDAVDEYVRAYSQLLRPHTATEPSGSRGTVGISEEFLTEYLAYRTAKDPAKRLLVGAFGVDWTDRVLSEVMFPPTRGSPLVSPGADTSSSGSDTATGVSEDSASDLTISSGDLEGGGGQDAACKNVPSVITFVTGNAKKRQEVEDILQTYHTSFKLASEKVDLPELQGEPLDIAAEKCRIAADTLGRPVITEDTSLCFHALKGLPGPYIKWFLEKLGHEGLNNLLLAYPDKSAYAQCIVAYCEGPGYDVKTFVGRTEGHIVSAAFLSTSEAGSPPVPVFGWDPIFRPLGFEGTYAQLPKDVKNRISHRYKAFSQLATYLGGKSV